MNGHEMTSLIKPGATGATGVTGATGKSAGVRTASGVTVESASPHASASGLVDQPAPPAPSGSGAKPESTSRSVGREVTRWVTAPRQRPAAPMSSGMQRVVIAGAVVAVGWACLHGQAATVLTAAAVTPVAIVGGRALIRRWPPRVVYGAAFVLLAGVHELALRFGWFQ